MRACAGVGLAVSELMAENSRTVLDLDVQHLTSAINAGLGIDPVRTKCAAVGVLGEFRSNKCICGAAIGAAALGLFTFRIGHKESRVVQTAG